jgi:dihydrofolate synthase/folylpolyglutamate synthase
MPDDLYRVVDEEARRRGASTSRVPPAVFERVASLPIGLAGAHQRDNAAIAYRLGEELGLSAAARDAGIAQVGWPGRLETLVATDGLYLLDAAHNPDGAAALAHHLRRERIGKNPLAFVFGALVDKDHGPMLDLLAPLGLPFVYAAPAFGPGATRSAALPQELAARHPGQCADGAEDACRRARNLVGPGGTVVVCGSIYLVGEVRTFLLGLPKDPPVTL